jgi:hypothetical protein
MNPYLKEILHNITTRLAKLEEQQADKIAKLEKQIEIIMQANKDSRP